MRGNRRGQWEVVAATLPQVASCGGEWPHVERSVCTSGFGSGEGDAGTAVGGGGAAEHLRL